MPLSLTNMPHPWRKLVETLMESYKPPRQLTDDCVLCERIIPRSGESIPPWLPHPTNKCGLLWTLTADGLAWLQARRKGNTTKVHAITSEAGIDADGLDEAICMLCQSKAGESEANIQNFVETTQDEKWDHMPADVIAAMLPRLA